MKTTILGRRVLLLFAGGFEIFRNVSQVRTLVAFRSVLGTGPEIDHRIASGSVLIVLVLVGILLEVTSRPVSRYFNTVLYGAIAAFNLVIAVSGRNHPETVSATLGPGLIFLALAVALAVLYRMTSARHGTKLSRWGTG